MNSAPALRLLFFLAWGGCLAAPAHVGDAPFAPWHAVAAPEACLDSPAGRHQGSPVRHDHAGQASIAETCPDDGKSKCGPPATTAFVAYPFFSKVQPRLRTGSRHVAYSHLRTYTKLLL
jgi:hypothetical protein